MLIRSPSLACGSDDYPVSRASKRPTAALDTYNVAVGSVVPTTPGQLWGCGCTPKRPSGRKAFGSPVLPRGTAVREQRSVRSAARSLASAVALRARRLLRRTLHHASSVSEVGGLGLNESPDRSHQALPNLAGVPLTRFSGRPLAWAPPEGVPATEPLQPRRGSLSTPERSEPKGRLDSETGAAKRGRPKAPVAGLCRPRRGLAKNQQPRSGSLLTPCALHSQKGANPPAGHRSPSSLSAG